MKPIGTHNYFVYITTNKSKRVLYTGVTNDLTNRLIEHEEESKHGKRSFAGRYRAYHLIYFEHFNYVMDAISREKQIKGGIRKRKEALINSFNPEWRFLSEELSDNL